MSRRILIVLEDPTLDEHVVRPIVQKICQDIGQLSVRVDVLRDPWMHGVEQALDRDKWQVIVTKYPMIDLFLLVIDRDCEVARDQRLGKLRDLVEGDRARFVGSLAIEEVEVWLLAYFARDLGIKWEAVRAECHPKERFFDPFVSRQGAVGPGHGRKRLMAKAVKGLRAIMSRCPEVEQMASDMKSAL